MRETKPKLKAVLVLFIQMMLDGESTPDTIRLYNLGFDAQAGEQILEALLKKGTNDIKELNLQHNPEFWASSGKCFDMLQQILASQRKIVDLNLSFSNFPYQQLRALAMPEAVKHQIEFEVVFTQENPAAGKRLIDRRAVRMAQCADATITGIVQFNDNQVDLPSPFTWAAMNRVTGADTVANKINLQRLNGAGEVINELLDFTVKTIPPEGL